MAYCVLLLLLAVFVGAQRHPPWLISAHARAWLRRGVQPLPSAARRMAAQEAGAREQLPVLDRPGLGIVKFGAGRSIDFRALRGHIVRATAQMARAREAGDGRGRRRRGPALQAWRPERRGGARACRGREGPPRGPGDQHADEAEARGGEHCSHSGGRTDTTPSFLLEPSSFLGSLL